MAMQQLITGLKAGHLVSLTAAGGDLRSAHRTADHIEQQLGVPLGRMEFVDRLCVILWLPGVAAHPLHPDRGIKEGSHARP